MSNTLEISFVPLSEALEPTALVLVGEKLTLGSQATEINSRCGGQLLKGADASGFKGRAKSAFDVLAPNKVNCKRIVALGYGKGASLEEADWDRVGGQALAQIAARPTASASVIVDVEGGGVKPALIASSLAFGALLRNYSFKKYKTKGAASGEAENEKDESEAKPEKLGRLVIHCADPKKAEAAFVAKQAVANGVMFARDLMNEPANVLGPVEFADRVKELEDVGLEVEILEEETLRELNMNTLLAVSQGSERPARVAIMQWNGAKSKRSKPVAFVGKGVVFDTGGISIKPSAGMEDMKGDMGGAACVAGVMRALAERNAPVNAVGLLGLVENMPSGSAIRPGDIVTSMSGQTVEILNTDAEGRLVLADVLWYTQERFKPKFVIDLATLTGAIMIALGKEFAGAFVNDDKLADQLSDASSSTGEKIWRMPLDKAFHKMIDGKFADVKNLGGRWGGACTAAAFLERFIKSDVPWAHIDLAGTAMDAPKSDINTSWGSGWGVQLLDRLVAENYEKAEK